jgi:hypothetical protein
MGLCDKRCGGIHRTTKSFPKHEMGEIFAGLMLWKVEKSARPVSGANSRSLCVKWMIFACK